MAVTITTPSSPRTKIDARAAALAAADYFKELYPIVKSFSLEEVELSEDGSYWLITLSFELAVNDRLNAINVFRVPQTKFKVFKVDAKTGKVLAMKIRNLQ